MVWGGVPWRGVNVARLLVGGKRADLVGDWHGNTVTVARASFTAQCMLAAMT